MSTMSSNSERYWALKSTNLKKIKDDGSKGRHYRKFSKNSVSNGSDIRKLSYPILPDVPFISNNQSRQSNFSKDSLNLPDFDSASTSDYGSDISVHVSPHYNQEISQKVVENRFYHGIQKNKNIDGSTNNTKEQKKNTEKNKKKFVLTATTKTMAISKTRNGMNLQIFHSVQSICLEIVDEVLEDEIVLDVMIDAFKEIQLEVEQFNAKLMPAVRLTADQILSECIDKIIHECALLTLMTNSKSLLRAQIVSRWTLDDVVQSLLTELAHDAVRTVVNDHLRITRSEYVFRKLFDEFITEDIISSETLLVKESILELSLEECVINPLIEDSIRQISGQMMDYYHQKISRINLNQINLLASEAPLASLVMSHFASVGARQKTVYGPSFVSQYCFENFAFEILLKKTEEIYDKLANTVECRPLSHFHREANQSIVSHSLLEELLEHTDADLCDLDAEEVQESYIPRYLGDLNKKIYVNNEKT